MNHVKTICVLASFVALVFFAQSCKKAEEKVIAESGKAPDFAFSDLDGGSNVRLSELRGKVVIVEFWATWCAPCKESVPELNKVFEKFRDKNFRLFGISVDKGGDALSHVRAFVKEHGIVYPVMVDSGSVNVAYGVSGIPVMFIIDKEGKLVKRHMGYFPGLAETLSKDVEELL
jgi:peroxiredoxin